VVGNFIKCCIFIDCFVFVQEEMVYEWLNPVYLKPDVQEQIREKFETDSEIELQGFLKVNCNYLLFSAWIFFKNLKLNFKIN